jgi:TatD DNase family protein
MAQILSEEHRNAAFACVMHCFSSGAQLARTALDLGFYLSMSGIAAFPKSTTLREIFTAAPLDRILVETDSPYLAPPPHRGRRNEPAYTAHTARAGAPLWGLDYEAFAAATEANFERLFAKAAA